MGPIYNALVTNIISPLLLLIETLGLVVFMWGVVEFLWGLSKDTAKKDEGKKHMLWGLVGMFVIVCAGAILSFIANSVCGGLGSCAPK